MTKLNGGYITRTQRAVKTPEHKAAHTGRLSRPMEGASLEALNWIQKTKWRVNPQVLSVIEEIDAKGVPVAGIPSAYDEPMPARMDDAEYAYMMEWAAKASRSNKEAFALMSPTEQELAKEQAKRRSKYYRSRGDVFSRNKLTECTRFRLRRMFDFAKDMAKFPAIWYPHSADFRSRVYPIPQDLHTQGDSLTKGMLTFAEKQRIGADGGYWLRVALANAFGQDKISLDARADWAENQMRWINEAAADPLGNMSFWASSDVDSPWEALALCFEVAEMGKTPVESDFESHIPVRLDATCSGIQHLSAMMKDELSASAVNVLPVGKRADIYTDVMTVAKQTVAMDAATHKDPEVRAMALKWLDKIIRKTVKRAVMTTPYGVTAPGIKNQLIKDGFCDHFEQGTERYRAAEYLKDVVVAALDANIGAPRAAMEYFQAVSQFLAEREKPLAWTTPAGFTVSQAYFSDDFKRVRTLMGDMGIRKPVENMEALDRRKQKSSAAPNVVHSYDAAHLQLVTVKMKQDGVRDLAFVHDSFGCHAGKVHRLNHHIREEFIGMYSGEALQQWRQSVIHHSGVQDVPEIPTLGSLDVTAVRESEFFFS
jgi:DNA-directed RNA polymerase